MLTYNLLPLFTSAISVQGISVGLLLWLAVAKQLVLTVLLAG